MRFPASYYYEEKSAEEKYGFNPPGELIVPRFIEGKPYWLKPVTKSIQKRKTLLLSSIISTRPSAQTKDEFKKHIKNLVDDGFDVYIDIDDKLVKLTNTNLFLVDDFKLNKKDLQSLLTPASVKQRACDELKLASSKLQLIGDIELNTLRPVSESSYSIDAVSLFVSITGMNNNEAKKWLEDISHDYALITHIHQDKHTSVTEMLGKKLAEIFPNLIIIEDHKEISFNGVISDADTSKLISMANQNRITRIFVDKLTITPDVIDNIKRIDSSLAGASKIRELFINESSLSDIGEWLLSVIKTIEFFEYKKSTTSIDTLFTNLNRMPELRQLTLDNINATQTDNIETTINKLQHLEIIEMTGCNNADKLLEKILPATSKLKSLKLNNVSLTIDLDWSSIDLSSLEVLEISTDDVSPEFVKGLISSAPNLLKLKLNGKFIVHEGTLSLPLPLLESIEVVNVTLSTEDVKAVLENNQKIKTAKFENNLRGRINISLPESIETFSFKQELNFTSEEASSFVSAINNADNLEHLELIIDPIIQKESEIFPIEATHLKRLELIINDPAEHDLQSLTLQITWTLMKCKDLKHLTLNSGLFSTMYLSDIDFNAIDLPYLTYCDIGNLNYDSTSLTNLLSAAPNLQFLKLEDPEELLKEPDIVSKLMERGIQIIHNNRILDITSRLHHAQPNITEEQLAPKRIEPNIAKSLDADTQPKPDTEFKVDKIFYPFNEQTEQLPVTVYRLDCYNKASVNPTHCTIKEAFNISKEGDLELIDCDVKNVEHDVYQYKSALQDSVYVTNYYGKKTIEISNEWQALPSISPNEEMLAYHLTPYDEVEIKYSSRDNQYYIRNKTDAKTITIDFIVAVPKETPAQIPDDIKNLVDYYKSFGVNKLELPEAELTGEEYLQCLFQQRVGACRHRALLMKAHIDRAYPQYQARIIDNICHSYVEINIEGKWHRFDLGGYPAKLKIDDRNDPTNPSTAPRLLETEVDNELSKLRHYQSLLRTWETKQTGRETPLAFYQRQVTASERGNNHLIKVKNHDDVLSLRMSLLSHCKNIQRPVFYIDSPDDLVCDANYLTRDGKIGKVNKGPGGALYDFLTAKYDKSNPPVLVVNYDNFDADDIVRLNTLIDKNRRVDTTRVPKSMRVIGIMNTNKPGCYQGSDFFSRFDTTETCTLPLEKLSLPLQQATPEDDNYIINLANASDWKERLVGRWRFQGDKLEFIEGELAKAIASGKPIEIQNGLWYLPKFQQFWHEIIADYRRQQIISGVSEPKDLTLFRSDGYDWDELNQSITFTSTFKNTSIHLNPTLVNDFSNKYALKDQHLFSEPGIIEKHKGETLDITLTRSITADEWATLLLLCKQHHVKLNCYCTEGTALPPEIIDEQILPDKRKIPTSSHTEIYFANDCDCAIQADLKDEDWIIIDISECQPSDLLKKLTGELDQSSLTYRFNQTEQALLNALRQKKNIALTGKFSDELVDAITSLILERNSDPNTTGQLRIYHDNPKQFQSFKAREYEINSEFKRMVLLEQFNDPALKKIISDLPESTLTNQSYCQLVAMIQAEHHQHSSNPWTGMHSLPPTVKLEPFDLSNAEIAETVVRAFNQERLDAVNGILTYSPYLFLAGLTAVGKTTFVEQVLQAQPNTTIYRGENLIKEWANDETVGTTKYLFIDEANVSSREWSEFESLFQRPPGILIDGVYHELTENHKVIFAGNPLSYGGDRKLAPFFERHGASVVFNPLPEAFIYHEIIKPVFSDGEISHEAVIAMTAKFLDIYRFLCERSKTEVLISPREIQMMALLVKAHHDKFPDQSIENAADHYGYLIANHLTPQQYKLEFDQEFLPAVAIAHKPQTIKKQGDYSLTPSRLTISQHLNDLIDLREYRNTHSIKNDAIKYGGLGGIIIEGEPGIGKSELVIQTLVSNGFHKAKLGKPTPEKPFYHLPINMSQHDKERILLTAFDQGAIVVIDEINSAPMMERLLNDLLMGRDPNGKPPTQPGFMVIGTQNPATMEGRREATTALARRLTTTTLPPYTTNEMIAILNQKGIGPKTANAMVTAYENNIALAKMQRLKPSPTFRDLIKIADRELRGINKFVRDIAESIKQHHLSSSYGDRTHIAISITNARIQHAIQQITASSHYRTDNETAYVRALVKQLNLVGLESCTNFSQLKHNVNVLEENTMTLDESYSNMELQLLHLQSTLKRNPSETKESESLTEELLSSIETIRMLLYRTSSVEEMTKLHRIASEQMVNLNRSILFIQSKLVPQKSTMYQSKTIASNITPPTPQISHHDEMKRK